MTSLTLKAPAKINLGLSILGKLPNGYHQVKTIYSQVTLLDTVKIREIGENVIRINCDDKSLPTNEENLVFKAASLFKKKVVMEKGVRIELKKNIPVGSGLGGGSSDAAAVLKGLNHLWGLNLSKSRLIDLAKKIGADVAYQLNGGVQLEIQGGEKAGQFTSLGKLPNCFILLCVPDLRIGSQKAYDKVEYGEIGKNNLEGLTEAIKSQKLKRIAQNLHNDFEIWTFKKYPIFKEIEDKMIKCGALGSLMSGKGSAVFGIFDNFDKAKTVFNFFKKDFNSFLVEPL